jgi:hypothetical protein
METPMDATKTEVMIDGRIDAIMKPAVPTAKVPAPTSRDGAVAGKTQLDSLKW